MFGLHIMKEIRMKTQTPYSIYQVAEVKDFDIMSLVCVTIAISLQGNLTIVLRTHISVDLGVIFLEIYIPHICSHMYTGICTRMFVGGLVVLNH